jgi:Mn2+/Fe2+ NRAMP family transporter
MLSTESVECVIVFILAQGKSKNRYTKANQVLVYFFLPSLVHPLNNLVCDPPMGNSKHSRPGLGKLWPKSKKDEGFGT